MRLELHGLASSHPDTNSAWKDRTTTTCLESNSELCILGECRETLRGVRGVLVSYSSAWLSSADWASANSGSACSASG